MKLYRSNNALFITGLIFISLVYSLNFIFVIENKEYNVSPITHHLIRFSVTVIVYLIGYIHLAKIKGHGKWMITPWHIINLSGLSIITLLGLFDWFIYEVPLSIRQFAHSIQEFLISPILYVIIGLLNRSMKSSQ